MAFRTFLALMASIAFCIPALAQSVTSPARGSGQRAEILNALRPSIEVETGGLVQFVVGDINVMGDWAYVNALPQRPNGRPIDWRATKYREPFEADAFSGVVLALLRMQNGRWNVVGLYVGPTDVAWYNWIEKFNLPEELFRT
jgi:hypothetical protein